MTVNKQAIENLGGDLQREAARRSAMLKQPVHKLYEGATEGGEVANALVDLKMKVEELDPGQFDFEPGWATRTIGPLPFVGTPLKRYFSRYEIVVDRSSTRSCGRCATARSSSGATTSRSTDDQKAMRALADEAREGGQARPADRRQAHGQARRAS